MVFVSSKKDTSIWLKVFSGICGNLAAGWFAITLASIFDIFALTKSLVAGIVFMWLVFVFERRAK